MDVDSHWPKTIDSLETAVYNELRNRVPERFFRGEVEKWNGIK